jgi:hypothetical protein
VATSGIVSRGHEINQNTHMSPLCHRTFHIEIIHYSQFYRCNGTSVKNFPKCVENVTEVITSKDVLYEAGMVLPIHCYLATFSIIFICLRVAAYLALRFRRLVPK